MWTLAVGIGGLLVGAAAALSQYRNAQAARAQATAAKAQVKAANAQSQAVHHSVELDEEHRKRGLSARLTVDDLALSEPVGKIVIANGGPAAARHSFAYLGDETGAEFWSTVANLGFIAPGETREATIALPRTIERAIARIWLSWLDDADENRHLIPSRRPVEQDRREQPRAEDEADWVPDLSTPDGDFAFFYSRLRKLSTGGSTTQRSSTTFRWPTATAKIMYRVD
jgi:hypothetical protein